MYKNNEKFIIISLIFDLISKSCFLMFTGLALKKGYEIAFAAGVSGVIFLSFFILLIIIKPGFKIKIGRNVDIEIKW